jgi:DNA-binding MarR family transcriptional regulator
MDIKLTVLERILLHLYPYRQYNSSRLVPENITQIGIAEGVNINYTHVPRAVKNLLNKELIEENTTHIISNPTGRRRRVYFLTDQGIKIAQDLIVKLADHQVIYQDISGKDSKIMLKDLKKELQTDSDLFTLYKCLNPDNIFELLKWEEAVNSAMDHDIKVGKEILIDKLELQDVIRILGPEIDSIEAEAIYHHTEGNPEIIKIIKKLDRSKVSELTELSAEERALTMCVMAQAKLENEKNNHK